MLPLPIISNTSKLPVSELSMLISEIQQNNYLKITNAGLSPSTYPSTTTMQFTGSILNQYQGSMWGSPYGTRFTYDSRFGRIFTHCLPDMDIVNYYKTQVDTPAIFTRTALVTYPSYISVTRNGDTSAAYSSYSGYTCTEFVYYDYRTGYVMQYDPSTMSTPIRRYG